MALKITTVQARPILQQIPSSPQGRLEATQGTFEYKACDHQGAGLAVCSLKSPDRAAQSAAWRYGIEKLRERAVVQIAS
ncbi:hypothetical protein, partial [Agrobacterium tumefaciens]|uniref:hypothetical protein n=1 Tax=Agrobacterium tumefaciens TaxID=358 RepID=UPI001AEC0F02